MKTVLFYRPGSRLVQMINEIPDIDLLFQTIRTEVLMESCSEQKAELLILEIHQSQKKHIEMISLLKQLSPETRIFVLTGGKGDALAVAAKKAGADIIAGIDIPLDELKQLIKYCQRHYRVYPSNS